MRAKGGTSTRMMLRHMMIFVTLVCHLRLPSCPDAEVWPNVTLHGSTLSPPDLSTNSKCLIMAPGTKQLFTRVRKDTDPCKNSEDVNVNGTVTKRNMKRNISFRSSEDRAVAALCHRLMLRCGVERALVSRLFAGGAEWSARNMFLNG